MITLNEHSKKTRWFAFCTQLPFSNGLGKARSFSSYRETGTTLCHFMWVTVWNPLWLAFVAYYVIWRIFLKPIILGFWGVYQEHGLLYASSPLIVFVLIVLVVTGLLCAVAGLLWLLGPKASGEPNLVVAYVKAIKNKVCPLVKFESSVPK